MDPELDFGGYFGLNQQVENGRENATYDGVLPSEKYRLSIDGFLKADQRLAPHF
jgi:hypothetical protein